MEEGGNKGETRGRNHERRVLPLVNLSRIPAQPSFDFQPGFAETLLRNISPQCGASDCENDFCLKHLGTIKDDHIHS